MDWTTSLAGPPPTPLLRKRPAETEPPNQRLSKRLSLLTIRPPSPGGSPTSGSRISKRKSSKKAKATPQSPRGGGGGGGEERMEVDHVVFIDSLSDYSSSDDEDGGDGSLRSGAGGGKGGVIFIPDIEKKLNAIPKHLLVPPGADEAGEDGVKGRELVLYGLPESLTAAAENNGVRKAILESRARIRERREKEIREEEEKRRALAAGAVMAGGVGGISDTVAAGLIGMNQLSGMGFMPPFADMGAAANGVNGMAAVADDGGYDPDAMDIEI